MDYTGGPRTITIAVGESEACTTFNIIDDGLVEGSESFQAALTISDLALDPQSSSATVTIADNGKHVEL